LSVFYFVMYVAMKKLLLLVLAPVSLFLIAWCNKSIKDDGVNIRIWWQTTRSTQWQLVGIFKNTEILKEHWLIPSFVWVSSGWPLNEAAMAWQVDVILTADQPAATLLSKNPNWTIVGRLMYNRVSLYVPKGSDITSVSQLKGKTIAMPFWAAAQRMAIEEEIKSWLNPKTDVNNINLWIMEQSDLVKDANVKKWWNIHAMAWFDPTPAVFEEKGLVNILRTWQVVSVIMMSNDFIVKNPDAPRKLMASLVDAYDFYRINVTQSNKWFVEDSKLNISDNVFEICSALEPNLFVKSKNDIRINFTENDLVSLQNAANFLFAQWLIKNEVIMNDFIKTDF